MLKYLTIACLWIALGAACGSNAPSGAHTSTPVPQATISQDDSNQLFVIPPVDNNVIAPTDTGPQVANFTIADVATYQWPVFTGVAGINATILVNSTPSACDDANTNTYHVGESQLLITITDLPDTSIVPGTYVYPSDANAPYELAGATYASVQSPCYYNSTELVSGQVVITDVQPASLSGSYSLTFASGQASGTFTTSPSCAALSVTPATSPACD